MWEGDLCEGRRVGSLWREEGDPCEGRSGRLVEGERKTCVKGEGSVDGWERITWRIVPYSRDVSVSRSA